MNHWGGAALLPRNQMQAYALPYVKCLGFTNCLSFHKCCFPPGCAPSSAAGQIRQWGMHCVLSQENVDVCIRKGVHLKIFLLFTLIQNPNNNIEMPWEIHASILMWKWVCINSSASLLLGESEPNACHVSVKLNKRPAWGRPIASSKVEDLCHCDQPSFFL